MEKKLIELDRALRKIEDLYLDSIFERVSKDLEHNRKMSNQIFYARTIVIDLITEIKEGEK